MIRHAALLLVPSLAACAIGDDASDRPDGGADTDVATPSDTDDGTPAISEEQRNLASGPGAFALDFLRDDTYTSLVIEVDHLVGHAPRQDALDALADTFEALGHKPGGVTVVVDDAIPADQGRDAWTEAQAEQLELAWRDRYRDPATGVAVVHLLYVDGHSASDTDQGSILAFAYHGSSLVGFPETIDTLRSPLPGLLRADPEGVVLRHEAGHLLGLVHAGIDMVDDHADPAHRAHDANDRCLMYYAVEGSGLGDLLTSHVPTFDDACLADVEAAGGQTAAHARAALGD